MFENLCWVSESLLGFGFSRQMIWSVALLLTQLYRSRSFVLFQPRRANLRTSCSSFAPFRLTCRWPKRNDTWMTGTGLDWDGPLNYLIAIFFSSALLSSV